MEKRRRISALLSAALITTALPLSALAEEYVVVKGDNLTRISARYNTTVSELVRLNSIKNPNLIYIGDVLEVGDGAGTVVVEPETTPEVVVPETTPEVVAPETTPAPEATAPEVEVEVEVEVEDEDSGVIPTAITPSSVDTKPSDILDFNTDTTSWKIQLPLFRDNQELSVLESIGPEMAEGYSIEDIFYVDESDNSVVFYCPIDGAKTANTSYTRNELREQLIAGDNATNWSYYGTHELYTRTKVVEVPSTGRTIVSQIHAIAADGGNENPLVKVEYNAPNNGMRVLLKDGTSSTASDVPHYFDMELGVVFDTWIRVTGGSVYVTFATNDSEDPTQLGAEYPNYRTETFVRHFYEDDPNWYNIFGYFKAGNYPQDSSYDYEGECAIVKLYDMEVFHDETINDVVPGESYALDLAELELSPGSTNSVSGSFSPVNTSDRALTWAVVSGSDVASVNSNGVITGISEGTAVIRATSVANSKIYDEVEVHVSPVSAIDSVLIYSEDFEDGQPSVYNAEKPYGLSDSGMVVDASKDGMTSGFSSGVFSLSDRETSGTARANFYFPSQETTTTIKFDIRVDGNYAYGTAKPVSGRVFIDIGGRADNYLSTSFQAFRMRNDGVASGGLVRDNTFLLSHNLVPATINPTALDFDLGQWKEVTMIVTPDDGTADANTTSVYFDGVLVADKMVNYQALDFISQINFYTASSYEIEFSLDNIQVFTGSVTPDVASTIAPTSWDISTMPSTMTLYSSAQISPIVSPYNANTAATYEIVSGDSVALSNSGLVTAKSIGESVIRVTSLVNPELNQEFTLDVVQTMVPVTGIVLEETEYVLKNGNSMTVKATVTPFVATETGVRLSVVSGGEFVSLDSEGNITGVANGTAVLRASSSDNSNYFVDFSVTVVSDSADGTVLVEKDTFSGDYIDVSLWNTATYNVTNTVNEIRDGKLYFEDMNTGGMPQAWATFEPQQNTFSVAFDLEIVTDQVAGAGTSGAAASSFVVALGSNDVSSVLNEAFCLITTGDASGLEVLNRRLAYSVGVDSTTSNIFQDVEGSTYDINTTYQVVLTCTPDNGTENANTTSVYFNGYCVAENLPNRDALSTIDQVIFKTTNSDLTTFTLDNFTVWVGDYSQG